MLVVLDSLDRESQLKKEVKQMIAAIHEKTKVTIENLTVEQALVLLEEKWCAPILVGIMKLPEQVLTTFLLKLNIS